MLKKKMKKLFTFIALCMCIAAQAARWNPETTDWSKNRSPKIGDWGFDRPGYPKGLYIHGITVKEGKEVKNAVIYDNDVFNDVFEDEWMFCMHSLGKMNLAGLIITPVLTDGWGFPHPEMIPTGEEARRLAMESGIKELPPVTVGSLADSEKEAEGIMSEGAKLYVKLINEAYKKNPKLPVIINMGGQSATLASAYCIDPSIADKCIVYYTDIDVYNGHYEWASKLVAKHFRVVSWGDKNWWIVKDAQNKWNVLPRPEHARAADNDENSGEWAILTSTGIPMLKQMVHQFRNRREYSNDDEHIYGDSYGDGTFMHAWLPGMFSGAEIRKIRESDVLHITRFTAEDEAEVKEFTMKILLDKRAYKRD